MLNTLKILKKLSQNIAITPNTNIDPNKPEQKDENQQPNKPITQPTEKTNPIGVSENKPTTNDVKPAPKNEAPKPAQPPKPPSPPSIPKLPSVPNLANENLFDVVKTAIDKKCETILACNKYYLSDEMIKQSNILKNKAVVAKNYEGSLDIHKISSEEDYIKMVKNGSVVIYEIVEPEINSFRLKFSSNNKNDIFPIARNIINKFEKINIKVCLVKNSSGYELKCYSDEKIKTNNIYKLAYELNSKQIDLSNLFVGKINKCYYSLDDNGNNDVVIEF